MVENLSENAVMCNFKFLNYFGLNFAEKDWYFGKYKISYLACFGSWIFVIKCWLTIFYKDNWSLSNILLELNIGAGAFIYLIKLMLFLWNHKSIYKMTELLKTDSIVIDNEDKRLEKDQKFCVKMTKSVFR